MELMEQNTEQEQLAEVRDIQVITTEIKLYKEQAGAAILEIGKRLIEAKEQLSHGDWLPWLEHEVEFSEASAQRFMRLAREYQNPSPVTDLGASKALILLALPPVERDEFITEKHVVNGEEKTVAEMSKRELEKAIRERDEARKQLEEEQKINRTNSGTIADLENDLEAERARVEEFEQERANAAERARDAAAEVERLQSELEELKNRPQEKTVETVVDETAVLSAAQAAREEAEKKLRTKIEKAEQAKKKAEDAKAAAEQQIAVLKMEKETAEAVAEKERAAVAEQMQDLQKKLAVASSSQLAIFKVHFEQGQAAVNKMTACIAEMEEAGDAEGAAKLKRALAAFLSSAQQAIG